jgi:YggT family protein
VPTALSILYGLLIAYLVLLSVRIALTWFAGRDFGRPGRWLTALTDPYLGLFSRVGFLHRGGFDLSPVAALLALVIALDLVSGLLAYGRITLGFFLAALLLALWSGARFLAGFYLVLALLRAVALRFRFLPAAPAWAAVDRLLQPVASAVARLLGRPRRLGMAQALVLAAGALLVLLLLGEFGVRRLAALFLAFPL